MRIAYNRGGIARHRLAMTEDYNGFINRSTWLARLHLDNTTKEVHEIALTLARKDKELRDDTTQWQGINYPHWQLVGNEKAAEELLKQKTVCFNEQGFSANDVR